MLRDGNIWIFRRCFNVVPPGSATCINANPPVLQFDPAGRLLKSFGAVMGQEVVKLSADGKVLMIGGAMSQARLSILHSFELHAGQSPEFA